MSDSADPHVKKTMDALRRPVVKTSEDEITDALRDHPAGKYGNDGKSWTDVAKQSALRTHL
jgi:hypothetical protein